MVASGTEDRPLTINFRYLPVRNDTITEMSLLVIPKRDSLNRNALCYALSKAPLKYLILSSIRCDPLCLRVITVRISAAHRVLFVVQEVVHIEMINTVLYYSFRVFANDTVRRMNAHPHT